MGRKYSKKGKNLTENFSNSHVQLFVGENVFNPELQIYSSNFQCKNFFQIPFFVEMQKKRVPPQSDIGLGGVLIQIWVWEPSVLKRCFFFVFFRVNLRKSLIEQDNKSHEKWFLQILKNFLFWKLHFWHKYK